MTANTLAGDRQTCLDAGMDDFIPKPLQKDNLLAMVAHWLPQDASNSSQAGITSNNSPVIEANGTGAIDLKHLATMREDMGEYFDELGPAFLNSTARE